MNTSSEDLPTDTTTHLRAQAADALTVSLLLRIQQHDREAYQQLYRLYRRRLHAYATQLMRSDLAADDIVQEAFERIWRYAPSFDAAKAHRPEAWLFQIVRNQSMTELARLARFEELHDDDGHTTQLNEPATLPHHDHWLLSDTTLAKAQQALPNVYRQVVFLRYHLELSLAEIAEHLGIPVGTAKTWLRRALITLREALGVPALTAKSVA